MTNSVVIYLPKGEIEVTVGKGGVKKIFTDKENSNSVVILHTDGITTYTGFSFICEKSYKDFGSKED